MCFFQCGIHRKCWRRECSLNPAQNILPTGVLHFWIYFCLTETQRDSSHDNLSLVWVVFLVFWFFCFFFWRERFYQPMSTVQTAARAGLRVFWSFWEKQQWDCRLVMHKRAMTPNPLTINCKITLLTADEGIKSVLHQDWVCYRWTTAWFKQSQHAPCQACPHSTSPVKLPGMSRDAAAQVELPGQALSNTLSADLGTL